MPCATGVGGRCGAEPNPAPPFLLHSGLWSVYTRLGPGRISGPYIRAVYPGRTDEDALEAALASGALHVSYRLVELEADDNAELRAERDRLLEILDACGGRNIEVAEEIDEINRQLGEDED